MGLSNANGQIGGDPINDCYGNKTASANTPIIRLIPPQPNARAIVGGFSHTAAGTAHTATMMTCQEEVTLTQEALAGAAVVNVDDLPEDQGGTVIAASDYCVIRYEDGTYDFLKVQSVSGLGITFTGTLAKNALRGSPLFFMSHPGYHTDRQFAIGASSTFTLQGGDFRSRVASGTMQGWPMLVYVDNPTAAGTLNFVQFWYE